MLYLIETTHGWAIVASDFLVLSFHRTFEEAAERRRQLLG